METNEELNIEQFGEGNILKYFKNEINQILIQIKKSKDYKICFTNSKKYNAKVRFDNSQKIIEINIGVIMLIYHISFIIMMNETFFPELGKEETTVQMRIEDFELPIIELRDDGFKEINFYTGPSNPNRVAVAQVIAMFGVEFVVFHEMGHVLGGHLEYIKDTLGIHELLAQGSELEISKKAKDDIMYQTIEMDADVIAIHLLLENTSCKINYIINDLLEGQKVNISKLIIIAIVIAFFLMDTNSKNLPLSQKYLPRDYRFHLVLSKFISKIKGEYHILINADEDIYNIVRIFLECDDFLSEMYNTPKISEIPTTELDCYYQDVILAKWKDIRADVQKYASIKLPE